MTTMMMIPSMFPNRRHCCCINENEKDRFFVHFCTEQDDGRCNVWTNQVKSFLGPRCCWQTKSLLSFQSSRFVSSRLRVLPGTR